MKGRLISSQMICGNLFLDFSLHEWTFIAQNVDKIKCTSDCVMRWQWSAEHVLPKREEYENCVDISINSSGSSQAKVEVQSLSLEADDGKMMDCNRRK